MHNGYIYRAPRDRQHPYMQLYRKVVQDTSVVAEARLLLIYILSLPENSTTDIIAIGKANGWGRDKTRNLARILEGHGYCEIENKRISGRFSSTVYSFYEECIEKILDSKDLETEPENQGVAHNDCEPAPENQYGCDSTGNTDTVTGENSLEKAAHHIGTLDKCYKDIDNTTQRTHKINAAEAASVEFSKSSKSKSSEQSVEKKQSLSEEAKKLQIEIEALMKSKVPTWNAPNSHFLAHQCDILLKDGATYQSILDVVLWALESEYWASALFTPKSNPGTVLRQRFSQWYASSKTKKKVDRKFLPSSNQERALATAKKMLDGAI